MKINWKNWNYKIRVSLIFLILAVIIIPFVDFFEDFFLLREVLFKPFYLFSFELFGYPLMNFFRNSLGLGNSMTFLLFWIINLIIYMIIGYALGYAIDLIKSKRANKE